jgi:integrase
MAELLRVRHSAGQSEYVFPNPKTGRPYRSIRKAWVGACRDAGVQNLNVHDLRHTAATRLADTGADPVTIAAILRHSDLRMTARYTHALDERNRRALARIASYCSESDCQQFAKTEERRTS